MFTRTLFLSLAVIPDLYCVFLPAFAFKAKLESDRLIVSVGKKAPQENFIKVKNHCSALSLAHRRDFQQLLQGLSGDGPLRLADLSFKEFAGFQIALLSKVAPDPAAGLVEGRDPPQHTFTCAVSECRVRVSSDRK